MNIQLYKEALKMFSWHLKRGWVGYHRYKGSAEQICESIIDDCWNGKFFQVSSEHYNLFYMRDFGWCTHSLLKLGYKEKVKKTLEFALESYSTHGRITTAITKRGVCFDFPVYAVDSLPYLVQSLVLLGDHALIGKYQQFLNQEIDFFYKAVIDDASGLVREGHFSSMRDHVITNSSCYNNCFAALLARELDNAGLHNPLRKFDYPKIIKDNFWNGQYFFADLNHYEIITADANLFPFYLGIINDPLIKKQAIKMLLDELVHPLPLKYVKQRNSYEKFILAENLVMDWETNSVWMHLGSLFLDVLNEPFPSEFASIRNSFRNLIEKEGNVYEVYDTRLRPYRSFIYSSDASMLWACNFLVHFKRKI